MPRLKTRICYADINAEQKNHIAYSVIREKARGCNSKAQAIGILARKKITERIENRSCQLKKFNWRIKYEIKNE